MRGKKAEELLGKIDKAFGFREHDFVDGRLIYTKWGEKEDYIDVENLGDRSLKIGKNLGDIYIDKISTDKWVIVGKGTTLHCDDLHAGEEFIENFEGFML